MTAESQIFCSFIIFVLRCSPFLNDDIAEYWCRFGAVKYGGEISHARERDDYRCVAFVV